MVSCAPFRMNKKILTDGDDRPARKLRKRIIGARLEDADTRR